MSKSGSGMCIFSSVEGTYDNVEQSTVISDKFLVIRTRPFPKQFHVLQSYRQTNFGFFGVDFVALSRRSLGNVPFLSDLEHSRRKVVVFLHLEPHSSYCSSKSSWMGSLSRFIDGQLCYITNLSRL